MEIEIVRQFSHLDTIYSRISRERHHRCVYNEIIVLYLHQKTKTIPNYQKLLPFYIIHVLGIKKRDLPKKFEVLACLFSL